MPTRTIALLEREHELAELDAMVGEAAAGAGRLAAIEARAGLGKTRLLKAAQDAGAQAGLQVLAARATELERDFPFALVRQLFDSRLAAMSAAERDAVLEGASAARGALGLANGAVEDGADSFAVLHGLYWLTAALAERHPMLLAIDDAHWSDAASLDYLRFLLPRLDELPVLVVVASRPEAADAAAALAQIVTDTATRRLTPAALSLGAATTLLAAELDQRPETAFVATCHEVSGGNPFLLCELARTLSAEAISPGPDAIRIVRELAPERVTRTVLMRVGRLSEQAGAVTRALVVLGDDSEPLLVAELAGLDAEAVLHGADELRAAAILDPGAQLRFIHPLVRNAVYSELPAGERAQAHARAADLLRGRGASAMQLAAHLVATEPHGERATAETLVEAGSRALASGAPQSAVAYLRRALREPPPEDMRAAVLDPLIIAGVRAADHSLRGAIETDIFAELERDPGLRSQWAPRLTGWLLMTGRFDQAIGLLEQAIEVAVAEDDADRAFLLEAQLNLVVQRPPAEARARLERYRDRIEPDSEYGRAMAGFDAQFAALWGTAPEAAACARRALDREGVIFDENPTLLAGTFSVLALVGADELDDAERGADWALAVARRRSGTPDMASAWFLRGVVAWARGDMVVAEADLRQAIETANLAGMMIAVPSFKALLCDVLIERGELAEAEAELESTGMATGDVPDTILFGGLLLVRGRLRMAQGRAEAAAADLVDLQRRRERWGAAESGVVPVGAFAAQALAAVGQREQARELAAADLVRARRWGAPTAIARALRALSATLAGAEALQALQEAVAVVEGSPARLERAHALSELGAALRRDNRRAEARAPLREALALARRCGAAGLAKRTHDELQASGERVRRYSPIGVESLTPSERRVAEMAASGMTNRQIAQTLFLTTKTIETHLTAAYDKLGIRSRRRLVDALRAT